MLVLGLHADGAPAARAYQWGFSIRGSVRGTIDSELMFADGNAVREDWGRTSVVPDALPRRPPLPAAQASC
jgi:hypothetical protein